MKKNIIYFTLVAIIISFSFFFTWMYLPKSNTYSDQERSLIFHFPRTVKTGEIYNGEIEYKGKLDSITDKFNTEPNIYPQRYILYRYTITSDHDYKKYEVNGQTKDTALGSIDCRQIPLTDIQFNRPGIFYIDGFLEDDAFTLQIKGKDTVIKPFRNKLRLTAKVIVID